jgi:IS30 family transposase
MKQKVKNTEEIRRLGAQRRKTVASFLKQGKSRRQIARELGCNERTVRRDERLLQLQNVPRSVTESAAISDLHSYAFRAPT